MKLLWIGTFVLLFASMASLISSGNGGTLVQQTWLQASSVIPEPRKSELERTTPLYTARVFESLPQQFRDKLARKMWSAVELITFRVLVFLHLAPALLLPFLVGLLEGWWGRLNQKSLIKIHSPMRFSLALTSLGLIPALTLLWLAAPIAISATVFVLIVGILVIVNTRNMIVHAPTQF
jgi:hypothetical protein